MAGNSIFIAHAPADAPIAEELTSLLAETGATVVYGADTSPTPEAQEDLERVALAADAYVVLLSRASIASPRIRATTRKYHEQRQVEPQRVLLPVMLEPFPPDQFWPFLLGYSRIEAVPRAINETGEQMAVAPEILALGVMQGLRLPVPARLRRVTGIPVDPPERMRRPSRPVSAPIAGSLVPQLQSSPPAPAAPWRSPRALTIGGVSVALVALLVATVAFFSGATPFHLAGSSSPTATIQTLILATEAPTPEPTFTATAAPTATAVPKRATPTHTPQPTPTATPIPPGTGLTGHYYHGINLQDPIALTRVDPTINFDWGTTAPDPQFQGGEYSVRWTGRLRAATTDTYTITFVADDGMRVYFGPGSPLVIDDWRAQGATPQSFNVALTAGQFYTITIEYFECCGGGAVAQLEWAAGPGAGATVIPASQLYAQ